MTDAERLDWIERTGAYVAPVLGTEEDPATGWSVEWGHTNPAPVRCA